MKPMTTGPFKNMKNLLYLFICLVLAGCDFTVPLSGTPGMAIDTRAVGLWEMSKPDGKTERLLVLPFNDREYFISWPEDAPTELYARAHLFEFSGMVLVQLQWFGNSDGAVPDDDRNYQVAAYEITGDVLEIRMLNPGVIGKDFGSSADLAGAVKANINNKNLFQEIMTYKKVHI